MTTNTHDIILEMVQSTLDESFIDANDKLQTLFAGKVKKELDNLRESIASSLYEIKKKV